MDKKTSRCIGLTIIAIIVIVVLWQKFASSEREGYKDGLWMNTKKIYHDYYPRSNGSIYGAPLMGKDKMWDMFNGFPVYPKAY